MPDVQVALVHGAFADSSGWNGVVERLQDAGIEATAISNPLRGIEEDAAYVASAMGQLPGPVLAVGHSYGGAVITNAASATDNVVGLVYVAAFAPDEGETLMDIESESKDSVLNSVLVQHGYPTANGMQAEFRIDPLHFHEAFARDIPEKESSIMAQTQRSASALAFSQPTTRPAWKDLPSWAVVPSGDKAAGADVLRAMATRARASITETEGSHVIMISKPDVVASVVMNALSSLRE
jgi:pimeloyl-ACP methyl ester carboxylesterase